MSTTISTTTAVTFLEGTARLTGKMTGIRDDFHLDILLDDGRQLRNVPHTQRGRHVGWYKLNPSELASFHSATDYTVT